MREEFVISAGTKDVSCLAADGNHTIKRNKPTIKIDKRDEASQHLIASVLKTYYSLTYKVFKDQVLKAPLQGAFIVKLNSGISQIIQRVLLHKYEITILS